MSSRHTLATRPRATCSLFRDRLEPVGGSAAAPRREDMSVLIAGNWKMFKGPGETAAFCAELLDVLVGDANERAGHADGVDVVVAPPFLSIHAAVAELEGSRIRVYAQNVHWEEEGAFTGEVSRSMLIAAGPPARSSGTPSGASTSARATRSRRGAPRPPSTPGSA